MIINANALNIPLADKSVHMIVTSPPYWGLRNYGVSGQLGLERTPEEYIANMVAVFRECWRVLRDDGTLWLNIGDSYAASPSGNHDAQKDRPRIDGVFHVPTWDTFQEQVKGNQNNKLVSGLKPKDLVGIPWRLAFALQADGWYLRSDIIWNKPNPMPESVTDRPTKSHEYLFLLAKRERYYYDAEAIREENKPESLERYEYSLEGSYTPGYAYPNEKREKPQQWNLNPAGRNRRTVWTIPTAPYKGAHFATFPPALVEPCIKAGTSERGVCPKCGKGWRRVIEKEKIGDNISARGNHRVNSGLALPPSGAGNNPAVTLGWQPSCTCGQDNGGPLEPIPAIVFDPFVGSGTTVKVAYDLGRRGVGLDLSLEYLSEQATTRIHNGHTGRLL